jgi:serine/threonine protein kinase
MNRLFRIYRQVLCAVHYLAELPVPISHGDIKPHNILVGERDLVKLMTLAAQLYQKKFTFVPEKMAGLCCIRPQKVLQRR